MAPAGVLSTATWDCAEGGGGGHRNEDDGKREKSKCPGKPPGSALAHFSLLSPRGLRRPRRSGFRARRVGNVEAMGETVQVEAARIPDRDRLLRELREGGLD